MLSTFARISQNPGTIAKWHRSITVASVGSVIPKFEYATETTVKISNIQQRLTLTSNTMRCNGAQAISSHRRFST